MNLRQIESHFQRVELLQGYLNYKYNPSAGKIEGIKQHIYKEELLRAQEIDQDIYGKVAFEDDEDEGEKMVKPKSEASPRKGSKLNSSRTSGVRSSKHATVVDFMPKSSHQEKDPLYEESHALTEPSRKKPRSMLPRRNLFA